MKDRHSTMKDIALGLGVAFVVSGTILVAQQVGTGPVKGARQDPAEPCCGITAIDAAKGVITAKVKATGQVFTIDEVASASLAKFTVGATIDLACGVPPTGGTTGATGNGATSGPPTTTTVNLPWVNSSGCGSNVPRNANTRPVQPQPRNRPTDCIATTSAGARVAVACPENVQIKAAK